MIAAARVKERKKPGRPPEIPEDPDAVTQVGPFRCRAKEKRYISDFVTATNYNLDEFAIHAIMNEIRRLRRTLQGLPEEPR
jgi:hypothetical protein